MTIAATQAQINADIIAGMPGGTTALRNALLAVLNEALAAQDAATAERARAIAVEGALQAQISGTSTTVTTLPTGTGDGGSFYLDPYWRHPRVQNLGSFTDLAQLRSFYPTGKAGDFAFLLQGAGNSPKQAVWDADEITPGWREVQGTGSTPLLIDGGSP